VSFSIINFSKIKLWHLVSLLFEENSVT